MDGTAGTIAVPDREPRARGKRRPQGEPVVDRALSLLAAFDASRSQLTLAELSRRSGISDQHHAPAGHPPAQLGST
jgi:hypothetical protein